MPTREWTPTEDALLGTAPDVRIAKAICRSESAVRDRRKRLGIPRFWKSCPAEADPLLGTMPDYAVAARIACNTEAVSRRRRELGIPAFRGG